MRPFVVSLVATLLLVQFPVAIGQDHEHKAGSPMAIVLHDGPDNGRAVAGGLTHFGFALLDKDGALMVHQDASVEVLLDGAPLFATDSAHEYDGLFALDVVFPRPGAYEVRVASGKVDPGVFSGIVVPPANETVARVEASLQAVPGGAEAVISIVDADGALLQHTDAVVEFRRGFDLRLVARTHAHIHDAPISLTQGLAPGAYVLHVTAFNAFPTGRRADFQAVVGEFGVDVPTTLPASPFLTGLPVDTPLSPLGKSAQKDGLRLQVTYDPYPVVAIGHIIRVSGLVTDGMHTPTPHVDFAFRVDGPRGVAFHSESLHEYDGMFDWLWSPDVPGIYEGSLVARYMDAELSVPVRFQATPPALPVDAGLHTLRVDGLKDVVANAPVELTFAVADAADRPLAHVEVDVTISRPDEAPAYRFKLHSHGDGTSRANVAFPEEGAWVVRVDPYPHMAQAVHIVGPGGLGAPIAFPLDVAPGLPMESPIEPLADDDGSSRMTVPGAAPLAVLALAGLVARGRRRR